MKQLATLYPQWGAERNEWAPTHQCSGCVPHPQAIQEALPREWCYRQVAGVKVSPQARLHEPSWRPPFQIILYCVKLTIKTDYHTVRSFVRLFFVTYNSFWDLDCTVSEVESRSSEEQARHTQLLGKGSLRQRVRQRPTRGHSHHFRQNKTGMQLVNY